MSYVLAVGAVLCLAASLFPLLPVARGAVRVFDFPRVQIFLIAMAGLAASIGLLGMSRAGLVLAAGYCLSAVIQLVHILPFTPFWLRSVDTFDPDSSKGERVTILVCNVKQSNRDYGRIIDQVRQNDPDIALFMETDTAWADALGVLAPRFTETLSCPLDNSYGMVMYSRLPLAEKHTEFLLNEDVPSFDCVMHIAGRPVRLFCVHPEPPVPSHDTVGRDAEIAMVGLRARDEERPVIVTGDLNDVAWSRTTRRFLRIAGLLDPREGRGFFNSFHAQYPFLRWPLDHIFHSTEFQIVRMRRLPFVGSDHFPMLYELALVGDTDTQNGDPDAPDRRDIEEADELVSTEKKRDRKPIGEDWEDG